MSKLEELIQELCPDGVEYKQLKDLGVFYGGLTGKSKDDFENGNKIFITYKNVYSNPSLDLHPDERVKIGETENQRTLEYGDVIFTGSSETPDECGISSVVTETPQDDLYLNSFCFIFRFNDLNGIYPPFMKHLFRSSSIRKQIGRTANGVTRYNVSKKLMAKISIPIPPLEVQEEIVRLLDDFTAKTAELQAELNKEYEARKKQYECYKDMLLNNPEDFMITTIGDISESVTVGIANSATQAYSETGVTMLRNQNIKENYLDDNDLIYINNDFSMKYKNKLLKKNDILVTRTGYPGVACVVPEKYEGAQTFTTLIVRLQNLKITNPKYVCYYINSLSGKQYVRKMQSGAAQQNFGATALSKMPINIPDITTQNYIVKIFENFDSTHSKISMALLSELESRQKQYEYYRDKLLTFKELNESEVN